MNCNEFQDHLTEWLDRPSGAGFPACQSSSIAGEAAFPHDSLSAAHLTECSSCREIWEEMQLLGDAVRAWQAVVPQVDLKSRVLAEWRHAPIQVSEPVPVSFAEEHSRSHQLDQRRSPWRRAAVAALLLAGVGIGFALTRSPQQNGSIPDQDLAVKSTTPDFGAASVKPGLITPKNSARTVAASTSTPLIAGALIRETATALTGAADALIPVNRAIVSAPPRRPRDETGAKGSEIVRREEETVPLSQHLRDTLDDLWLPAEAPDFPPT